MHKKRMKMQVLAMVCLLMIVVSFVGCFVKSFTFMQDVAEMEKIEIIRITGYDLKEQVYLWDVLYTAENKKDFIDAFLLIENKESQRHYPFWFDYGDVFIYVVYKNGDKEYIDSEVQYRYRIDGLSEEAQYRFNKEQYDAFLQKHLS